MSARSQVTVRYLVKHAEWCACEPCWRFRRAGMLGLLKMAALLAVITGVLFGMSVESCDWEDDAAEVFGG